MKPVIQIALTFLLFYTVSCISLSIHKYRLNEDLDRHPKLNQFKKTGVSLPILGITLVAFILLTGSGALLLTWINQLVVTKDADTDFLISHRDSYWRVEAMLFSILPLVYFFRWLTRKYNSEMTFKSLLYDIDKRSSIWSQNKMTRILVSGWVVVAASIFLVDINVSLHINENGIRVKDGRFWVEKEYDYSDVIDVEEKYLGKEKLFWTLRFRDGYVWDLEKTMIYIPPDKNKKIYKYLIKRTKTAVDSLKDDEKNIPQTTQNYPSWSTRNQE